MISKAKAHYVRMSPQKIRLVLDLIRKQPVPKAYSILDRTTKRASIVVKKLLMSAADSAQKQKHLGPEALYISKITADGAGMLKRWRSMSMGRAGVIRKRMSHLLVELEQIPGTSSEEKQIPQAKPKTEKKLVGAA